MTNEQLNAKYSAFHLIRWSAARGAFIAVGKPRSTIEAALKAAMKMDARHRFTTFVDVVRPQAKAA